MSLSTVKIDFTKLNESETKEVLSRIQEYENTCEKELRGIENATIASNVLQTAVTGAAGALTLSIVDKAIKDDNMSKLEKTLFVTAGLVEIGLCTIIAMDNISNISKVLMERKKRTARTNILNADTKAELSINRVMLKKQEEESTNVKSKKK
jgi:hypothetical protein